MRKVQYCNVNGLAPGINSGDCFLVRIEEETTWMLPILGIVINIYYGIQKAQRRGNENIKITARNLEFQAEYKLSFYEETGLIGQPMEILHLYNKFKTGYKGFPYMRR